MLAAILDTPLKSPPTTSSLSEFPTSQQFAYHYYPQPILFYPAEMVQAYIYVSQYRPVGGNANGEPTEFHLDVANDVDPRRSRRFIKNTLVAEINEGCLDDVHTMIRDQPIRNNITTWSCQDFVMEAIESLHDADLLEVSDGEYEEVMNELLGEFY
ncbi:hypothetical protein JAAARDRAFT_209511 [Jaapia argillacea MUCL 33604]|uniref:Uncharacterized protein n=1 Tax=Jaapia argillacea MUCL 33604 TaxID=933084 RepID=A0A067PJK8_9AGAM|nr:hypothetical protein JAAARDRAFT_209511 [Jaapia argillacea MUCL 33604]